MKKRTFFVLFLLMLSTLVSAVDIITPTWSNQNQNASIIKEGSILLSANLSDETALDSAWLSTNESGSWFNYTSSAQVFYNDIWFSNSTIVSGLGDIGDRSTPTIYQKESVWNLITGNSVGTYTGFTWNGTQWVSNSSIISGLTSTTYFSAPAVYQKDGVWNLIAGAYDGVFYGHTWNGTQWVSNSTIVSGLGDIGDYSKPTIYRKDGILNLIAGSLTYDDTGFIGFTWNNTQWVSNSTVIIGLEHTYRLPASTIYQKNDTWILIIGGYDALVNANDIYWYGHTWNGTQWILDTTTTLGLSHVDRITAPRVFKKDGVWNLITGEFDGIFHGFTQTLVTSTNNYTTFTWSNNSITNDTIGWKIYFNDTSGNNNVTDVLSFVVDSIIPSLKMTLPENTTYGSTTVSLNYSVSDDNLDSCWYEYNNTNTTVASCLNTTFTALDNQQSTLTLFANDSAANLNNTAITFTVDTIIPTITIVNPENITYNNTASVPLDVSIDETVDWCGYSLNGDANVTFTPNISVAVPATPAYQSVEVFCNDTAGGMNTSGIRYFTINSSILIKKSDGSATDSYVIESDDTTTRTYFINNTGASDVTSCNFTFVNRTTTSSSLNAYASFNESNLTALAGGVTYFTMTLTNVPASGTTYYEEILATCVETTATMAIDVSSTTPTVITIPSTGGASSEDREVSGTFIIYPYGGKYLKIPLQLIDCGIPEMENTYRISIENTGTRSFVPTFSVDGTLTGVVRVVYSGEPILSAAVTDFKIIVSFPENASYGDVYEGGIYVISGDNVEKITTKFTVERFCIRGTGGEVLEWFKSGFYRNIHEFPSTKEGVAPLTLYWGYLACLGTIAFLNKNRDKRLAAVILFILLIFVGTII